MAQDYHIYITSKQAESPSQKTVPWENFSSDAEESNESIAPFITKGIQKSQEVAQSGFGSAVSQGVSMLAKAHPVIAIIVALVKVTDKVLTTGFTHAETYTGDYTHSLNYENIKTTIGNIINPIGYVKRMLQRNFEFDKNNKKIESERVLVGSSTLRNINRGV